MTGGEAVVAALRAHGVTTLFGLPGLQLDGLFNALHGARHWLRVVHARHEQGVAYMALGYAAATGRTGVFAVVPGPGFLNTTAALATAYTLHAPVLALVGQITSAAIGVGLGELHELPDQTGILSRLTRWNGVAMRQAEIAPLAAEAFAQLASGGGPAGLELPRDILARPGEVYATPVAAAVPPQPPDAGVIRATAALLAGAGTPMIIVGGGAIGAGAQLRRLSRLLQAPVASHLLGRGILDSRDPYALGRTEAAALWPQTDVVLAVGTRLNSPRSGWRLRSGQRVIRIDIDPAQFGRGQPPDIAVAADAAEALTALIAELGPTVAARPSREAALRELKAATEAHFHRILAPQMGFLGSLRATLPEESVVVADYTQVGYVAAAAWPVAAPRRLISPGYQGTLGFGFATGLGAKLGCPAQPVVCLTGDGGFLFTATELATAAQHRIPLITVVFNDGAYGNVKRMQEDNYGGRVIASDLQNPDFRGFAASFGVAARRATEPEALGRAVRWAMQQDAPTLIEVPVGKMPQPWALLEPSPAGV
jgi:acetolactate synthase-1/2/3 large subunit